MSRAGVGSHGLIVAAVFGIVLAGSCSTGVASDIVRAHQKISDIEGGFTGVLEDSDYFGWSAWSVGDLDGDGVEDLAVGAYGDDDGGTDRGGIWVLFMNSNGTVKAHQKISDTEGGFTGVLDDSDYFGWSVCSVGDLDGDGVEDLAVGAAQDDDGGINRGAVWVLFMNSIGSVKGHQKISDTQGGFTGVLDNGDHFGSSLCSIGDLDGDGVDDLAAGATLDDDGGTDRGAVWVLFMNSDGTVKAHQKISDTQGGFAGALDDYDIFGCCVCSLGDMDGDGVEDMAVGAQEDDDGGPAHGAVWVLFLNSDGTVKTHQKISDTEGGFTGVLKNADWFGSAVCSVGDFDRDGVEDLAVGAHGDKDGGFARGAVWVLFMNPDGTVKAHQKISDTEGGFTGILDDNDYFGCSVCSPGDLDGDGFVDLAVGARCDDDGGSARGAVWVLFLWDEAAAVGLDGPLAAGLYLQAVPNPCHERTRVAFGVDRGDVITLAIYDVRGRLVRTLVNRAVEPGAYSEEWNTRDDMGDAVPSGIYLCRLARTGRVLTARMVLLK